MKKNLVEIDEKNYGIKLDLRYNTTNNICGIKLYSQAICYLHKDAAGALKKAVAIASKYDLRFKVFDGFRPIEVQQFMYNKFPSEDPNGGFVSNPLTGSIPHCRGVAIDLTLIDANGNELEMGSDFDEFTDLAFHDCKRISPLAKKNRQLLFDIMTKAGWDFYSKEWWHYQLFKPREYAVIEDFGLSAISAIK